MKNLLAKLKNILGKISPYKDLILSVLCLVFIIDSLLDENYARATFWLIAYAILQIEDAIKEVGERIVQSK